MDRRSLLLAAGGIGAAAALPGIAGAKMSSAKGPASLTGPYIDLTTGRGNMMAMARLDGNLDQSKEKFGSGTGTVSAVVPGGAVKPLFGAELYSVARLEKQPDDSYHMFHREIVYYTDLKTGEIIDEAVNPYTGEKLKVVHVVNDPWNEHIEQYAPQPPSYGGLIKRDTAQRPPLMIPWNLGPRGMLTSQVGIDLYYPAALQPDKWPRESAGKMNQVSEIFTRYMLLEDMQNPAKTSVEHSGTWSRVTPWLPWMLMGQAPGHIMYNMIFYNYDDINRTKRNVLDRVASHEPHMMHAPTDWNAKSLSSLENYARNQQPAPPKQ